MDKASWVKTESLSDEQELEVSSHDGEYCSKGVDRSRYCMGTRSPGVREKQELEFLLGMNK